MDFSSLQRKLLLRISSPAEYLHALTTHWFLILSTTAIGTLVLFTVSTSQPTLYEARATLQINPNEPLVEPGTRPTLVRNDLENFLNDQIGILQSQTVLQTLVASLGYHGSLGTLAGQETEKTEKIGRLQSAYRELRRRVERFINDLHHPVVGSPEEVRIQKAVRQFQKRSQVLPQENSHQVRLVVTGATPESLVTELQAWITVYRKRIEDFSEESAKRFLEERKNHWEGITRDRKEALDRFRKENPHVSEAMHRFLQTQIIRQEMFLDSLRTRLTGISLELEGYPGGDIHLLQMEKNLSEVLKQKKEELEIQRVELSGHYPETSEVVKAHDAKIREVERSLQSLGASPPPAKGSDRRKAMVDSLGKNIEHATAELEKAQLQLAAIETKMVEYRKVQADLQYAEDKVRSYERSMDWRMESTEGQKLVQVQVWDKPTATTIPVNSFKVLEAGYGTLGGLAVGFILAFFKQFFRKTIRFKRDVAEELGLEVIGVIPVR